MRRPLIAGLIAAAIVLSPAAAWAHITIEPGQAAKGAADQQLTFRVPNESETLKTVKVEMKLPTDHPLLGVEVEAVPGWNATVKTVDLPEPVKTDDGEITQAVSEIAWSGGSIPGNDYANLRLLVGRLPDDTDQLTFKVLQTYDDGSTVSWIEETPPGGAEPEHPAPVLELTGSGGTSDGSASPTTAEPTVTAEGAGQSEGDDDGNLAGIALGVGALALVVAVAAVVLGRRRSAQG